MGCNLVLTVGNAMMGDDGAGPYIADKLQAAPCPAGSISTAASRRKMWSTRCGSCNRSGWCWWMPPRSARRRGPCR